jgi:hypothetical protein
LDSSTPSIALEILVEALRVRQRLVDAFRPRHRFKPHAFAEAEISNDPGLYRKTGFHVVFLFVAANDRVRRLFFIRMSATRRFLKIAFYPP